MFNNRQKARLRHYHKNGGKRRGIVRMSFELLEQLLDLMPGTIRSIQVRPECEMIEIVHDDKEAKIFDIAEGQYIPGSELEKIKHEKMGNTPKEKGSPA